MIQIDGSLGEGGGQVLRSALTLAVLTRQAVAIRNIRARRSKPGLQAQHLKSVEAAAAISGAATSGAQMGSTRLTFSPGETQAGRYHIDIGTAGSTALVLQTIFVPLSLANGPSTVTLIGGTHVPWSPSFHYLEWQWLPYLRRMGFDADLQIEKTGFYPQGGGKIRATIRPAGPIAPLEVTRRGRLVSIEGISAVANLDPEIAKRQKLQALRRLEPHCRETKIKDLQIASPGKGTFITLLARCEYAQACFGALGERGKRAEAVADEAADALETFMATDGAIDLHLADQILLPLAFARGVSRYSTSQVTQHLLTNADVVRAFTSTVIDIQGGLNKPGIVTIQPSQ
jgi:RNA 3'-terminal phosphate cyclase (ATP)